MRAFRLVIVLALIGLFCQIPLCAQPSVPTASAPATQPWAKPENIPGIVGFAKISDDLYRGAQPAAEGFLELKKRGIKTIVNLRSFHDDQKLITGAGFQYFHIHAKPWHPETQDVVQFLKIIADPQNRPVYVHCQQGVDRTGWMVAVYRMVIQGWNKDDAIGEMKSFGFHSVWTDIPDYLSHLDPATIKCALEKKSPATRPVK